MTDSCIIETDNLIVLKKAAPKLKEALRWANIVTEDPKNRTFQKLQSISGVIFFQTLHWTKERAVMDNIFSVDSECKVHQHPGVEVFIVYKGTLILLIDDEEIIINNVSEGGKPYYIDSTRPHSGRCEVDTELIAITIPGDEDWQPHGTTE